MFSFLFPLMTGEEEKLNWQMGQAALRLDEVTDGRRDEGKVLQRVGGRWQVGPLVIDRCSSLKEIKAEPGGHIRQHVGKVRDVTGENRWR